MTRTLTCLALAAAVALGGCATKRYPIATRLAPAERAAMDCRELQLELARAVEVQRKIAETAEVDWRSAAAFMADFGIGNAMAKSEADAAVRERIRDIEQAKAAKNCPA